MNIAVDKTAKTATIEIEGIIGMPEWMEQWFTEVDNPDLTLTKEKMRADLKALKGLDEDVELINVIINSPGGFVDHAITIYDLLVSHPAKVKTIIGGMSASAATIISHAADPGMRYISDTAFFLPHRARGYASGTVSDIQSYANTLAKIDERIAKIYSRHSGRSIEEHLADMSKANEEGEWLTAEEAVAAGYADERTNVAELPAAATARFGREALAAAGIKNLPTGYAADSDPTGVLSKWIARLETTMNKGLSALEKAVTPTALPQPKTVIMLTKATHKNLLNALNLDQLEQDEQKGVYLNPEQLTTLQNALASAATAQVTAETTLNERNTQLAELQAAAGLEVEDSSSPADNHTALVAEINRLRELPGAAVPRTRAAGDPGSEQGVPVWEDPDRDYNKALVGLRPKQTRVPVKDKA